MNTAKHFTHLTIKIVITIFIAIEADLQYASREIEMEIERVKI